MILILPAISRIFVARMPISETVPRKPSIETISPTLYSFSKMMKIPAMMSAMRDWAPKPTISVKTPTDSQMAAVLTPKACKTKKIKTMAHPYLMIPSNKVMTVFARLLFFIALRKMRRSKELKAMTTVIKIAQ